MLIHGDETLIDIQAEGAAKEIGMLMHCAPAAWPRGLCLYLEGLSIEQAIAIDRALVRTHAWQLEGTQSVTNWQVTAYIAKSKRADEQRRLDLPPADPETALKQFIAERTEHAAGERLRATDVNVAWEAFAGQHGVNTNAINSRAFAEAWRSAGVEKIRSNGVWYLDRRLKANG